MWTISMLKKNAWNSLKGYYRKGMFVCFLMTACTVLFLGFFSCFLFSFFSGAMLSTILPTEPGYHEMMDYLFAVRDALCNLLLDVIKMLVYLMAHLLVLAFFTNPVEVGICSFFRKARNDEAKIGEVFCAFHDTRYRRILWIMLCRMPYICIAYVAFKISTIGGLGILFIPIGILVLTGLYQYTLVPFILSENPCLSSKRVKEISKRTMKGEKRRFILLQLSFIGWFLLGVITLGVGFIFSIPYYQATKAEFYACMRAKMIAQGITTEEELTGAVIPQTQQQPYRYDMLQTGGQ